MTSEEANELKKQLIEIERLSRLLNKNIDTASLQNLEQQAGTIRTLFAALKDELEEASGDAGYFATNLKKIVQEITKSNIGVRETTKAYNKLSSIAEKIQSYQRGYSDLTTKEIKKLREQFSVEKTRLENSQDILKDKKDLLEAEQQQLSIQLSQIQAAKTLALQRARAAQASGNSTERNVQLSIAKELQSQERSINRDIRKNTSEYEKTSSALNINNIQLSEQVSIVNNLDKALKLVNQDLKDQEKLLGLGGAIVSSLKEGLNNLGFTGLVQQLGIEEASDKMREFSKDIVENRKKELELLNDLNKANVNNYTNDELRRGLGGEILKQKRLELDALAETNAKYTGINGKIATLKVGIKSMGKSLIENLTDPLTIAVFVAKQLTDALKSVDGGTGEMAKDLNLSYAQSSNLRNELNTIANLSMDNAITTKGLQDSYVAISKALGANADINKEDLETFTKLREQAGYTNEELIAINKISMGTGKNVEDTVSGFFAGAKALSVQKGVAINVKQLLKETANVSNAIKLSLGGSTEALGKAAAQAKAVGMNLEQADKIASSLLNFEDSISAELEAELLTGKNINLERARLAAINGDIGTVAEEINKQLGGSAEFTKMNRLQQEAMAKAVGMTREELANSLVEQEALQRTGFKTAEAAKARYEELRKTMSAEEAAAALGDEELAKQYEQQSVQEKFNQTVEKLKEIFVSMATALMPVFDIFSEIFKVVGYIAGPIGQIVKWTIQLGKYLIPIYGIYKSIQVANLVTTSLLSSQAGIYKVHSVLAEKSLATRVLGNAYLAAALIKEQGLAGLKTYALSLDDKSITKKVILAGFQAKEYIQTQLSLGLQQTKLFLSDAELRKEMLKNIQTRIGIGLEKVGNSFKKGGLMRSIGEAAMSAIKAFAGLGPIGWAIGLAAAGGAVALGMKFMNYGDDVVSKPGYGSRTLMGPEGAIQLNDKDTIVAGTDLFGGNKTSTSKTTTSAPSVNISGMMAELQAIKNILQQIASTPGVVELDGTIVGKTLTPLINTENLTTSVKTQ